MTLPAQRTAALAFPGAIFTETALTLDDGLPWDDYCRIVGTLEQIDGAVNWWLGDAVNFGGAAYGEKMAQAFSVAEDLERPGSSLAVYAWVAAQFPDFSRLKSLSWSHHQEAAGVESLEARRAWLALAVKHGWSKNQLRQAIKQAQADERDRASQQEGGGTTALWQGDALDWIAQQQPYDLLLTDPPYMTDTVEPIAAFAARWVPAAVAKIKPTGRGFIFTGAYPEELHAYLGVLLAIPEITVGNILVWHYPDTLGPSPTMRYAQTWQAIFYLYGAEAPPLDVPKLTEQQTVHTCRMNFKGRHHQWQKPLDLAEMLVRHGSQPGDTVADPFAGTGTFLVAAAAQGRHGVGAEIDDEQIAVCRGRGITVV